ncbi:hypothetical protein F5H01DRAFT_328169 [Linnemannia elongata]|nr:hypothetical protein F5H01DRAFT_328169 [Linnemannia elongata]
MLHRLLSPTLAKKRCYVVFSFCCLLVGAIQTAVGIISTGAISFDVQCGSAVVGLDLSLLCAHIVKRRFFGSRATWKQARPTAKANGGA